MTREKDVEQRLVKKIKARGGLCLKWTSPGTTGVPDRLVFFQGRVIPVELKSSSGVLSARQTLVISQLLTCGVQTLVLSSFEEVDEFVDSL